MRLSLVILAVIGFAAASPLSGQQAQAVLTSTNTSARNDLIEQVIVLIVESLRDAIVNGNELTPSLDPYEKDYYYFDGEAFEQPGSHLEVKDVYATGLGSFVLEEIDVEVTSVLLQWYRADLKLAIPSIVGTVGNYDIYATIWDTLIWGNGEASLTITNLVLDGYLNLAVYLDNGLFLTIRNCRISLSVDDFVPYFTGVYDSEASSLYAADWLRTVVLSGLDIFADVITLLLSGLIESAGNRVLEDWNIAELLVEVAARV